MSRPDKNKLAQVILATFGIGFLVTHAVLKQPNAATPPPQTVSEKDTHWFSLKHYDDDGTGLPPRAWCKDEQGGSTPAGMYTYAKNARNLAAELIDKGDEVDVAVPTTLAPFRYFRSKGTCEAVVKAEQDAIDTKLAEQQAELRKLGKYR